MTIHNIKGVLLKLSDLNDIIFTNLIQTSSAPISKVAELNTFIRIRKGYIRF